LLYLIGFYLVYKVIYKVYRFFRAKNISGQTVVITGGGSGLGRRVALKLSELGCTIVIWDINEEGINKVVKEIKDQKKNAWGYKCNVMSLAEVTEVGNMVQSEVGKVDILINNAGIVSGKFLLDLSEEHINRTFNVNTISHFWTIKQFLPDMLKTNLGHIVTIASAAGITGTTGLVDYCASKFGAFGTNESLRLELRKKKATGVDTLVVCPYFINTGMFDGVKTRIPFLLPILEEEYVANIIVDAIVHRDKILITPWIVNIAFLGRFLFPVSVCDFIMDILGVTDTMNDFKGRGWSATDPNKKKQS